MSTSATTITYLLDQLGGLGARVRARKMFGEYALYCDNKVVALVCDDTLFLKPLTQLRVLLKTPHEAPPYPGAKQHYCITGEHWEDAEWLCTLVHTAADALPLPKKKKTFSR
jgi:TfoX/Sxy family transcriptional regulator of competence genes